MVVDIETLDTARTAIITEIGIIVFTKDEVLDEQRMIFDIRDQVLLGRTVSRDTVEWHHRENTGLSAVIYTGKAEIQGLERMMDGMYREYNPDVIWARGSLDKDVLEDAITLPFKYYQWRDCRTLDEIARMDKVNNHNALTDCRNQMEHIRKVLYGLPELPSVDGGE